MSAYIDRSVSLISIDTSDESQREEEPHFVNTVDVILKSKFLNCISINEENCKDVYVASRYFNITELVWPSTEFMMRHLYVKNCINVFFFARKWKDKYLMLAAAEFFFEFFDHFTEEKSFLTLELGQLLMFLCFIGRHADNKEKMFQSVCRWIIFNKPKNLNLINQILKYVPFPYCDSFFDDCIKCMAQLKKNYFCKKFMKQARLNNLCPSLTAALIDMSTIYNEKKKNHIFVVGQSRVKIQNGFDAKYRSIIEYFCPAQQKWTILEYFPKDIREYQSVISEDKIYFAGGYYAEGNPSLEVWSFDWETSKWTELGSLPMHVSNFGFVQLNNFLYLVGGKNSNEKLENTILQYDLESNECSIIGNLKQGVLNPAVVIYQEKIFVAGGATEESPKGTKFFQSFDLLTRTWDELPPLPSKKTGATICVYGEFIYIFGGCNSKAVHCFNTRMQVWNKASAMKKKREKAGLFVVDQYIFLAGGKKGKKSSRKSIERYDTTKNKWKIIGSMASRGSGITCSYIPVIYTDCGSRMTLPIEDVRKTLKISTIFD